MKLSKSLLQAILVSVTAGAVASCSLIEPLEETDLLKKDKVGERCTIDDPNQGVSHGIDCPAC
ncbi:MAG: hypothetical protein KDC44_20775, partial [Phaeodactylibacter sp.]|nr:hypothetical protein [Phaeodactylibacter sp.]